MTALFLGCSLFVFAQEETEESTTPIAERKHEFRVDALEGLVAPAIDVSYEYVISKYSGAGVSVLIGLTDENSGDYPKFAFTPYYRQYFFNKQDYGACGFFAEGLLNYSSGTVDFFTSNDFNQTEEDWSAFGIGFAIGQKWISQNGFIVEISAGVGRNFGDDDFAPEAFFRGGVSIGYRL